MNLQTFIEETIAQVVNGVANAQKKLSHTDAIINPYRVGAQGIHVEDIKFDVAVEASSGSEGKADGGISVLGGLVKAGGERGSSNRQSEVSRILFSVPLCLPPPPSKSAKSG